MEISLAVWEMMQSIGRFMPIILISALLMLAERHLIKKNHKGKIILPVVVLILTAAISLVQFRSVSFELPDSLRTETEYTDASGVKSHLTILHTEGAEDGEILSIGQLVTEEGGSSKFIDLSVKDGAVTFTSEPVENIEEIEKDLSHFDGRFSGKSVSYEKLMTQEQEYRDSLPEQMDFIDFLYSVFYSFIPAVALLVQCGAVWLKRRCQAV